MLQLDAQRPDSEYRSWLLPIAGGAVVLGFFLSVQAVFELRSGGRTTSLMRATLEVMPYWVLWALAAPIVVWTTMRIRAAFIDQPVIHGALLGAAALGVMLLQSALLYESQVVFDVTDLRIDGEIQGDRPGG